MLYYHLTGIQILQNMIISTGWEEDILKMVLMFMHWFITKIGIEANDAVSGDYYSTSIVYYSSSDGGATWTSRPSDYVVYSESDNTTGHSNFQ